MTIHRRMRVAAVVCLIMGSMLSASAQQDIKLAAPRAAERATDGPTIKLDEFVVATSKDMDGAAIAINEQRFAPNIVNTE